MAAMGLVVAPSLDATRLQHCQPEATRQCDAIAAAQQHKSGTPPAKSTKQAFSADTQNTSVRRTPPSAGRCEWRGRHQRERVKRGAWPWRGRAGICSAGAGDRDGRPSRSHARGSPRSARRPPPFSPCNKTASTSGFASNRHKPTRRHQFPQHPNSPPQALHPPGPPTTLLSPLDPQPPQQDGYPRRRLRRPQGGSDEGYEAARL